MSSENAQDELAGPPQEGAATSPRKSATSAALQASSARSWFAGLFDQHADVIFNYCYRRAGNRADAEDLLSAVFLTAWGRRQSIPTGRELPWLYGVATNVIRNHRRSQRRRLRIMTRLSRERQANHTSEEEEQELVEPSRLVQLLEGLAALRQAEQDVFVLCVWQELTYEDAALALGIPVGTVRSRLSRAREKLRELGEGNWT